MGDITVKEIDEVVTCKTCANHTSKFWAALIGDPYAYRCKLEFDGSLKVDAITGKVTDSRRFVSCRYRRGSGTACGPAGKQWVPINKNDLFKLIKRI